jgi:hypothetical protein
VPNPPEVDGLLARSSISYSSSWTVHMRDAVTESCSDRAKATFGCRYSQSLIGRWPLGRNLPPRGGDAARLAQEESYLALLLLDDARNLLPERSCCSFLQCSSRSWTSRWSDRAWEFRTQKSISPYRLRSY